MRTKTPTKNGGAATKAAARPMPSANHQNCGGDTPRLGYKCAIYPGSFDPPTLGHLSLVERGLFLFDKIIVAVAENSAKSPFFTTAERVEMLKNSLAEYDQSRIEVDSFEGLLVDYARKREAAAIMRGLRATGDFEYEFQMALVNRHLDEAVQSVFLMTDFRWLYISSSIVKEAASYGADVSAMVPPPVAERLKAKFAAR